MKVVAEWFVAMWSWLTEWVSTLGYLGAAVLAIVVLIVTSAVKAVTTETVRRTFNALANREKLKATGTLVNINSGEIKVEIKNIGSKKVTIKHLGICQVKTCGMGLFGSNRKYESCLAFLSITADDNYFPEFVLEDPRDFRDQPDELEVGQSCTRSFEFYGDDCLSDLAKTKEQAKVVQFVVYTERRKFPVKSEKPVKKLVVSSIISAIAREKQNAIHQLEHNENPHP